MKNTSLNLWRQCTSKTAGRKTPKEQRYPISFVEGFGHDVLIIRDEAIKTKQTEDFLQKMREAFIQLTENDPQNTTYLLCPRVGVNDQLGVDDSTSQGPLWVFMMGKEESRHFPVDIVTVDLE